MLLSATHVYFCQKDCKNKHLGHLNLHLFTHSVDSLHIFSPTCNTFTHLHTWQMPTLIIHVWLFYCQLLESTTHKLSGWYFICLLKPALLQSEGGRHNATAAGRKSHRYVATPSHTDRGRRRHQSFTNSFKCERVLVVSAKGERWSWPEALNEGRTERRMKRGEGPHRHREPPFWGPPHLNPAADTPGRPTRWRQH